MDITAIKNSPGMWIAAGIMILIIVIQAALFMRMAKKEANALGISKEKQKEAKRSAVVAAVGPTLALSIMLVTLMASLGGPTAWMRMNDVGSGRTELAIASTVEDMVTAEEGTEEYELQNLSYAVWAQGIDVAGWLIGAMAMITAGGAVTKTLNEKFDPKWIKLLMGGCLVSLFSYLLINQVYGKASPYAVAAVAGGITMFILNKAFAKNKRLQELGLGISIIVGAAVAAVIS
ncbi:MAG TPA: DUF5058 family protein [Candidatus Intestinimonas stercoravium]|uniref:DUF5058 family protein n=1 Tax=uncultured Intestinimonas sp. TaxID=1689265 RepID=UPI001F8D25DB|nr:DUF5058 family protein [uncultured Intestinimonas sp.]HJA63884.1 DUF5058 family protein [Candidatus Intestinimonas stercoravium]